MNAFVPCSAEDGLISHYFKSIPTSFFITAIGTDYYEQQGYDYNYRILHQQTSQLLAFKVMFWLTQEGWFIFFFALHQVILWYLHTHPSIHIRTHLNGSLDYHFLFTLFTHETIMERINSHRYLMIYHSHIKPNNGAYFNWLCVCVIRCITTYTVVVLLNF